MLVRLSLLVSWVLCALSLVDAQRIPVTGFNIPSGNAVPYRKNINTLQNSGGPQWDLYIRALTIMMRQGPREQNGYFQIAGIHGKPYVQWNGAGARTGNGWAGYCPHGESLFLPWHRPYVVLFEQRLVEIATDLANKYPPSYRATYQRAARELRAPWWDWAATRTVPAATVPDRMRVMSPGSGDNIIAITLDNPLKTYRIPQEAIRGDFGSWDPQNRATITRCTGQGQSYPNSANQLMQRRNYRQWVYDAFTRSTTFDQFASTSNGGVSLEQIHNSIHWDGACGGQFLAADFSAFDPLFMLHHTNVDRLWTYWQFMRPSQSGFRGSYAGQARWNHRTGQTVTPSSPLQPFYQSNGQFHTSGSVNSIRNFGYTYWGLEYWRKSGDQLTRDATAEINKLYGPGAAALKRREEGTEHANETTRYFAQIEVDVEELERPCAINVYINDEIVGDLVVLQQPAAGKLFGKFSLDESESANPVKVIDLEPEWVVDDIMTHMKLEIVKHDGTFIDIDKVPSLKVELENVHVEPPKSLFELPEFYDAEEHEAPKEQLEPELSDAIL